LISANRRSAFSVEIRAGHGIEQTSVRAVRDSDGQGFLIEVATDDALQQPAHGALPGVAVAEIVQFLLKNAEGPQAVVLFRKPRMQVVIRASSSHEKKLPVYKVAAAGGQMLFLQMSAANYAGA